MSETPTPRMDAACDNLDDCLDWEQIAYRVAAEGQKLERELTAERAARERAEAENATLRGLLGNSGKPCAYCGLPVERWGECALGFPGCARADDAQLSDLFAIGAALAEAEAGRVKAEAGRDALREDAERYRWLRNDALTYLVSGPICVAADRWGKPLVQHYGDDPGLGPALHITIDGKELDAAIDAARAAAKIGRSMP